MDTKKTKDGREKAKSNAFGFGPMGHGMSEMMKCCTGQGGFPDCSAVMEGMMDEMKKQQCRPKKNAAESERKKK